MSSIGLMDEKWINEFRSCFAPNMSPSPSLSLVWPSREYVLSSIDGESAGGSLFLSERTLARQCVSGRLFQYLPFQSTHWRVPPHIKTYALYNTTTSYSSLSDHTRSTMQLVVLSSANFSKAAWGSWIQSRFPTADNSGGPKSTSGLIPGKVLLIRNFELGVLFRGTKKELLAGTDPLSDGSRSELPLPYDWREVSQKPYEYDKVSEGYPRPWTSPERERD